jgi:predicted permease
MLHQFQDNNKQAGVHAQALFFYFKLLGVAAYLNENSHFEHACNILQAALPLAVTSFVYAEEYKVHADIMSTGFVPFTTRFLLSC